MTIFKWVLGLAVLVFVIRACNNMIDPANVTSDMNGVWSKLVTFNGSGDQATPPYASETGVARVHWTVNNTVGHAGQFKVCVRRPDGSLVKDMSAVTIAAGARKSGERAFTKAKDFYLEIQSTLPWEITLEQMK